jgi:hypothetical protein
MLGIKATNNQAESALGGATAQVEQYGQSTFQVLLP